ncbi:MAG TPA: hypothetical protein VKM93_01710 [Terriglobia bacterium]|nr:hypothetical protein [Terriglobia bacterium]
MPDYSVSRKKLFDSEDVTDPTSEAHIIKDNMAKIALCLDQLAKAVISLREQAAKTDASLREQAAKTDAQLAEIKSQFAAIKIHTESLPNALREAKRSDVAVQKSIADFSAKLHEVESLREQAAKTDAQLAEMESQFAVIKIHAESLPNALREAKRSDVAVQKTIADFSARLYELESRLSGTLATGSAA